MAEIQEEANGRLDESILQAPVIGVCMGKEQRGLQALKWALESISAGGSVYILHVRSPLRWIPSPMGGKLPISQVNPELAKRFKNDRFLETKKLFDPYKKMCDKKKVTAKFLYSENDSVEKEIVNQISKLGITTLVLESSSQSVISKAFTRAESISAYVATHAPAFCTVVVIRKGKLFSVKDASQSLPCSSRSSISAESAISLEASSMSGRETPEDHYLASCGSQIGRRGMQTEVKNDSCSPSHGRPFQSVSMDISRGSPEWLIVDDAGHQGPPTKSIMKRNHSSATPFHRQPWNQLNSNAQPIHGWFEGQTSRVSDASTLEGNFLDSSSQGHELTTPFRVPFVGVAGSSTSLTTNESFDRSLDTPEHISSPEFEVTSHTSMEMDSSTSQYALEGSSVQNPPMDSNTGYAGSEVLLFHDFDFLESQLIETRQAAQMAQREAERQANHFKMAEEVVANARKMIAEHERLRNEALNDAKIALQKASVFEKRWEDAVATLQGALRDKEISQERFEEEVRKHQETRDELETQKRMVDVYASEVDLANQRAQAERDKCEELLQKLEEVTGKLEEECQLRKEAEERASQEATARRDAVMALRMERQKYTEYTFEELQSATNNFHEENKLGQGGYGPVYKGKLHHTTVAIKVLARECSQGRVEFQKEVEVLSCIRHPNMVILLGACPEKGCLVYEYMANGSLEDRLNCRDGTPPLPWYVRFRICLEVATALLFLHSRPHPIVHRDLKPGNILLDHHFVSKISDVGLAKLVPTSSVTYSVTVYKDTVLVGTFAYMDPDYQRTGVVSCESDVYSLGIVMLQLLTGRQAVGVANLVEDAVDNNQLEDVLDKSAGDWPLPEAMALACLGLECAEPRRKNRPNLEAKILPYLESIQSVPGISMAYAGASSSADTMPMIPSSFYCPISQDIMEDPHLAADGFTYEHDAIQTWLQDHDTSPMTNLVLSHKILTPNHSIRSAIKEWYDNGLLKRHDS